MFASELIRAFSTTLRMGCSQIQWIFQAGEQLICKKMVYSSPLKASAISAWISSTVGTPPLPKSFTAWLSTLRDYFCCGTYILPRGLPSLWGPDESLTDQSPFLILVCAYCVIKLLTNLNLKSKVNNPS